MSTLKNAFGPLRYFLWIIVPVIIFLIYLIWGLPHVRWSYSWLDQGQGNDPFADRNYTSCTYWGPYGGFTVYPNDGNCALVWLFKKGGGG